MNWEYTKKYKSRKGADVKLMARHGPDTRYPVVVAYKEDENSGWRYASVTEEGHEFVNVISKNDVLPSQVTVRRVLEVTGPEDWVNQTLEKSIVQPDNPFVLPYGTITEVERTVISE